MSVNVEKVVEEKYVITLDQKTAGCLAQLLLYAVDHIKHPWADALYTAVDPSADDPEWAYDENTGFFEECESE